MCNKVYTSFNAPTPILQPLSNMNLGYWWSLDFVGPLPITKRHKKYVLVMISTSPSRLSWWHYVTSSMKE